MKRCIDCYGNEPEKDSESFLSSLGKKQPCFVDSSTKGTTYLAFKNTVSAQPIHRVVVDAGVTEILWGYGKWSDRETIIYDSDLNTPMIVETV